MLRTGAAGLILAVVLYVLLGFWTWVFDVDTNIDTGTTWPFLIVLVIVAVSGLLIALAGFLGLVRRIMGRPRVSRLGRGSGWDH
jgi:TRAP-type C4-dicarboxylate transport system permease small subunit